jgi:hypothetical protein
MCSAEENKCFIGYKTQVGTFVLSLQVHGSEDLKVTVNPIVIIN